MIIVNVTQARYFVDEVKDKTGEDIDISNWEKEFVEELPEQKNGFVIYSFVNHVMRSMFI